MSAIEKAALGIALRNAGATATPVSQTIRHLILLDIGQSNQVGENYDAFDPILDALPSDIYQFSPNGGNAGATPQYARLMLPLTRPLLHPQPPSTSVSPTLHFALNLRPYLTHNERIVIVPCAVGGSAVYGNGLPASAAWCVNDSPTAPDGYLYRQAKATLQAALAFFPNSYCPLILHTQVEADYLSGASLTPAANATYVSEGVTRPRNSWLAETQNIFASLRSVPGAENATIVIGAGPVDYEAGGSVTVNGVSYTRSTDGRNKQAELALLVANSIHVTGAARGNSNGSTTIHLPAAGYREMGRRGVRKYVAAVVKGGLNIVPPTPVGVTVNAARLVTIPIPETDTVTIDVQYTTDAGQSTITVVTSAVNYWEAGGNFTFPIPGVLPSSVSVRFRNRLGYSGWSSSVAVPATKPAITSPALGNYTKGTPSGTFQLTATYGPSSYQIRNQPSWVTLDSATGILTFTSVPTTTGPFSFEAAATNAAGQGEWRAVSGAVVEALPYITTTGDAPTITLGQTISFQIAAAGAPIFSLVNAPGWATINASTGLVTGKPVSAGPYMLTVKATNETGTVTQSFAGRATDTALLAYSLDITTLTVDLTPYSTVNQNNRIVYNNAGAALPTTLNGATWVTPYDAVVKRAVMNFPTAATNKVTTSLTYGGAGVPWTKMFWMRWDGSTGPAPGSARFCNVVCGSASNFTIKADGSFYSDIGGGNGSVINVSAAALTANQWYHVAIIWNGTKHTLYMTALGATTANYIFEVTPTGTINAGSLIIGGGTLGTYGFAGDLFDVELLSRAVTVAELNAILVNENARIAKAA